MTDGKVPVRERMRVDRAAKWLAFDVTSHCGPDASLVMLNTFESEHTYYLTPTEALKLASALRAIAENTLRDPKYERPPWLSAGP